MLYRFFNTSSLLTIIVLMVSALILWIPAFMGIQHSVYYNPVSPLFNFINQYIGSLEIVSGSVTLVLIFLQAIVLNNILDEYDILPKNSSMTAYVFLIIASSRSELLFLNPFIFSGLFLILSLGQIFLMYGKQDSFASAFNAGLFISLASMCYFPTIFVFILVLISFIIYRQFFWREWLITIAGLFVPYLFLATYYFWTDQLAFKYSEYLNAFKLISISELVFDKIFYIQAGFIALIVLFAFFRLIVAFNEKPIRIRKAYSLLIWFLFVSFAIFIFSGNYYFHGFWFLIIPVSAILSGYFLIMKNTGFTEIILMLLCASLIVGRLI